MTGLSDLTGRNGVIEQLLLWNVVGQVVSAVLSPAFTVLQQDAQAAHPEVTIAPETAAQLAVRHMMTEADARTEAGKSGISASRFDLLSQLATIRIQPADLAEAVLRSYMTRADAEKQAAPQGIDAAQFGILTDLAGDGIGPQQAAEALRRGIIPDKGTGIASVSYEQAIAESRLHDKWGPVLYALEKALLSPPDAAEAVVRGFLAQDAGTAVAALSGVDAATFGTMVRLAGDAPGPQQLAEALRRGAIPYDSGNPEVPGFMQGIREGRLANMWAPVIEALAKEWPTPVDAIDATLKGQLTDADGKAMYERLGGDTEFYQWLLDSAGNAPSPLELIEMANRGYIPWTGLGPEAVSYEQGFKEGRWRNKWSPVYEKYAAYIPDISTVVTLLAHGTIDDVTAAKYLAQRGVDSQLAAAYLDEAHVEALSEYRGETVSTVLSAYYAQILSTADATQILESLHVTPRAVELLISYQDVKRAFASVNSAVSRIRTLFTARKITAGTAQASLITIGLPADTVAQLMATWELENSINVKTLTAAQIGLGFVYGALTQDEAIQELVNIGYTEFDAWVVLAVESKKVPENKPVQGPLIAQDQVVPGTT